MFYRIKEGSSYHLSGCSGSYDDDQFRNCLFPKSIVDINKCACDEFDCQTMVAGINVYGLRVVTDAKNLEIVS